jgi:hypothetical protein
MKEIKLNLAQPATYQITVPGELDESWAEWYEKLVVVVENNARDQPVSTLSGTFDQAALQSLLRRLYSLGLPLISVICLEIK